MSELLLPINRLSVTGIADVQPGRLLIIPPTGREAQIPSIVVSFEAPNNRPMALALSPVSNGRFPAGDMIELSLVGGPVLLLDGVLTVEANLTLAAMRGSVRDLRPGELVDTEEGMGIAGFYGRHNPTVMPGVATIDTVTWKAREREIPRMIFGGWRLRIDIPDLKAIHWTPTFGVQT